MGRRSIGPSRLLLAGAVLALTAAPFAGVRVALAEPSSSPGDALPPRPAVTNRQSCAPGSPTVVQVMPWAQRRFGAARLAPVATGEGVLVAVLDTGVSRQAPALAGAVAPGTDVLSGTGRPGADSDCDGHGTFVAGLIAARPQPGSALVGLAPGARILPVRVADTETKPTAQALAAGIAAAANAGAGVITVPLSVAEPSDALSAAVRSATDRGALVVAAADRVRGDGPGFPAAYPEVLAVGAVQPDGSPASFSAVGAALDVVAPGVAIAGPGVSGPGHYLDDGAGYAAAFVAATAALIRSVRPQLSPAQVAQRIVATADRPGGAVPDPALGSGVVDPYPAVTTMLPTEWRGSAPAAGAGPALGRVTRPRPGDHRPAVLAYAVAGSAAVVVAGAALTAVVLRRRRAEDDAPPGADAGRHGGGLSPT